MLNGKRVISASSEQGELLPTYPSELVPEEHPARVLNEIVESCSPWGSQAVQELIIIAILFVCSVWDSSQGAINRGLRPQIFPK